MISCTRAGCQKRIVSVCVVDGDDDDDDDDGGNGDDEEEDGARPSLSVCPFFFVFSLFALFLACSLRSHVHRPMTAPHHERAPQRRAAQQPRSARHRTSAAAVRARLFFPPFSLALDP